MDWQFKHSVLAAVPPRVAWNYWSNFHHHSSLEPSVDRIELDGPFESGTTGRTIMKDHTQEWQLNEVIAESQFVIKGYTPDGQGSLSFEWIFEQIDMDCRLTQTISAIGPNLDQYIEELELMKEHVPKVMLKLVSILENLDSTQ